jgi:ligand-binding sensor domain-containing protein
MALALLARSASALDPAKAVTQYVRDDWGLREGLPQLSVQGFAQTPDGYLWVATEEGLVRFDGVRFTVFDEGNTPGLRSRNIEAVTAGTDGALWIGTIGGGVARLKDGVVTSYGAQQGLQSDVVLSLLADRAGDLWVGTQGGGLAQLHDGSWRHYRAADGLPSDEVTELESGSDGSVWIGTTGGLARLKNGVVQRYAVPGGSAGIATLREDRRGRLWIGLRGGGLFQLEGERIAPAALPDGLGPATVRAILDDSDGNLWLGTDAGLKRLSGGRLSTFGAKEGLAADTVLNLWEDGQHALWLGLLGGGLARLRDGDFTTYSRDEGLPHDFVRTISEDARGDLWIGSRGGGLAQLREGRFTRWGEEKGIHPFVYSVLSARDGSLWAGTHGAGVARMREGGAAAFTRVPGLPSDLVRALYEDRAGALWIGTEGGGLARWDGARFHQYTSRDGLAYDSVYCMLQDRRGDLWVGTDEGLSRMRDGRFHTYRVPDGLAGNQVRALYEDATGTLWIGTLTGLSRLREGRFTTYWRKEGLADAVFAILEDSQGQLWLSGNRGVVQVRRSELEAVAAGQASRVRSRLFGMADGLKSSECNGGVQPAAWKARDGRLWFATMRGAAVVDPARLRAIAPPPAPVLETGSANGRPVDLNASVRVPPGDGRLELSYTSARLSQPENVSFFYRLDGFDRDWIEAGPRRVAYYTNVPPGRYRFRVKACGQDGTCSADASSRELELAPHFFQTRSFTLLCLAGAGLVLWSGHHLRVRRLQGHERELQRRVDEAVSSIKVLSGLLPICAWCKKVRDDQGYWSQIETYIGTRTQAEFTHGICPSCREAMRSGGAAAGTSAARPAQAPSERKGG